MMNTVTDPVRYEAWYHTPRGQWMGKHELSLLMELMQPSMGSTLLDVGSGTGYFSRGFSDKGLKVTGLDPDPVMVNYAHAQAGEVDYIEGFAERLPFEDNSFDYCSAVTSLCFINEPVNALSEMWRVSQRGVVLGLLNRNSLLYREKYGRGGYIGARWDRWSDVMIWLNQLVPAPEVIKHKTTIFIPDGGTPARFIEFLLPGTLPWGGFLAIYIAKHNRTPS